jgi:cellulose synthase/poly-beta-1,6-N-acetylglucosamine synthase-like glycosyltransferase
MDVLLKILLGLFAAFQLLLAFYIAIPLLCLLTYFFFKLFRIKTASERKKTVNSHQFEFGIIVTVHQDTKFISPILDSIERQHHKNYHVYVVADDCTSEVLEFQSEKVTILLPESALNSKIKSIKYAINSFKKQCDAIVILDADNLIHPSFLRVMNNYFQKGYKVVQAHFKAKNADSHFARMDAIGDFFNFFIEREVRAMVGFSATIWGSGIAIDYTIYKEVTYTDYLGGFDKKLQAYLVQRVDQIAYAPDAILFDEKISSGSSLENQRTRWISSYFKYFNECFSIFFNGVRKVNPNLVYFGLNTLRPPLFITLGLAFLVAIINYFLNPIHFYIWLSLLFSFFFSFICIVLIKGKDWRYLKTVLLLPLFVVRQILALLKIKKAKKSFLKTENQRVVYIEDLLKKDA